MAALFPNAGDVDRLQLARSYGCRVASSETLEGLFEVLDGWDVDPIQTQKTVRDYDQKVRLGQEDIILDAPTGRGGSKPSPLVDGDGPFYAMEVQPS